MMSASSASASVVNCTRFMTVLQRASLPQDRRQSSGRRTSCHRPSRTSLETCVPLYPYAQNKGKRVAIGSKVEALVCVLAHETRHMCQHHGSLKQSTFPTAYARNSRGQFSEVDTESYAVNRLRAWQRAQAQPQ